MEISQQTMSNQQPQQQKAVAPSIVPSNQLGVPSVVLAGAAQQATTQIPDAGSGALTAQQLTAMAAASGGAVIIPGLPGPIRLPPLPAPSIASMMLAAPGLAFPTPSAIPQQTQQVPASTDPSSSYRDYSRSSSEIDVVSSTKDDSFPMKLHKILSDPEYAEYISFLPHGRAFRIIKPKAFEEKVIPKFFRHAKYASFMRQVNGWGFKRISQGPDHNSYYHELFLRGLPNLCLKMKRPAKTAPKSIGVEIHPDFHSMNIYAPLPNQQLPVGTAQTTLPSMDTDNNYSGSDASERGIVSTSVTSNQGTSDSDPNAASSDSERNGSSARDDSGGSDEGDRNSSEGDRNSGEGSSDGRDETNGSDRDSDPGYTEDISGSSDRSVSGSDTERNGSGSEGFESSSSPTTVGKKFSSGKKKRRHPRQMLLQRADSSFMSGSGGSDSSERSSIRELSFLSNILRQADATPLNVGDSTQDVTALVGPDGAALGLPAAMAALSGAGQLQQPPLAAASQSTAVAPPTAPLTAANLSAAAHQQVPGSAAKTPTAPLTAANLSAAAHQQLPGTAANAFTAPLTAANLSAAAHQQLPGVVANTATVPLTAANLSAAAHQQLQGAAANTLTAANLSAANQQPPAAGTAGYPFAAPLTATNLNYLSLQNQLIQSQATIAQLLAYQQRMGLPPMPAAGVLPQSPTGPSPGDQRKEKQQG